MCVLSPPPCHHPVIPVTTVSPPCHHNVTIMSPLCHHCVTTVSPPCHHCVTTVTSVLTLSPLCLLTTLSPHHCASPLRIPTTSSPLQHRCVPHHILTIASPLVSENLSATLSLLHRYDDACVATLAPLSHPFGITTFSSPLCISAFSSHHRRSTSRGWRRAWTTWRS